MKTISSYIRQAAETDQFIQYRNALKELSNKFQNKFGVFPQINDVRTSKHPDYDEKLSKGTPGYIDFGDRVMYVDFAKLIASGQTIKSFVAHELGHWLDQYLGGTPGRLSFSESIYPEVKRAIGRDTKYSPAEAFASTIDYMLTEGKTPGPAEKIISRLIEEKLHPASGTI